MTRKNRKGAMEITETKFKELLKMMKFITASKRGLYEQSRICYFSCVFDNYTCTIFKKKGRYFYEEDSL